MIDQKELRGLLEAYASVYQSLSESHFKVGDEVICKDSGMEGEVVKVDPEEKGKYYTVKREDGKKVKYAPDELKREKEENEEMEEEKNSGASKESETKFHTKLDKMVHSTFGKRKEEMKKEGFDIFDTVLEFLQVEGYAKTLEEAEWMMANVIDEEAIAIVIGEAQAARENPEKYEREQSKKYAPVRGEKTPMPPRGDKRREDFEKWYAKNVR